MGAVVRKYRTVPLKVTIHTLAVMVKSHSINLICTISEDKLYVMDDLFCSKSGECGKTNNVAMTT